MFNDDHLHTLVSMVIGLIVYWPHASSTILVIILPIPRQMITSNDNLQ